MRFALIGWALAGVPAVIASPAPHGLKIVVVETFPRGTTETTKYVDEDRTRMEWRTSYEAGDGTAGRHEFVHICRCDLNSVVTLDMARRTYQTGLLEAKLNPLERAAFALRRRSTEVSGAPSIVVETTTVDTGERKIAFEQPARRIITTRRQIGPGDSQLSGETVTDGWYIDLDTRTSCERSQGSRGRAVLMGVASNTDGRGRPPHIIFEDIGAPEEGYPIETTTTSLFGTMDAQGRPSAVASHSRVTHLSRQRIETSLFEIPPGFRSTDGRFSNLAARASRTTQILGSVVASWFR